MSKPGAPPVVMTGRAPRFYYVYCADRIGGVEGDEQVTAPVEQWGEGSIPSHTVGER